MEKNSIVLEKTEPIFKKCQKILKKISFNSRYFGQTVENIHKCLCYSFHSVFLERTVKVVKKRKEKEFNDLDTVYTRLEDIQDYLVCPEPGTRMHRKWKSLSKKSMLYFNLDGRISFLRLFSILGMSFALYKLFFPDKHKIMLLIGEFFLLMETHTTQGIEVGISNFEETLKSVYDKIKLKKKKSLKKNQSSARQSSSSEKFSEGLLKNISSKSKDDIQKEIDNHIRLAKKENYVQKQEEDDGGAKTEFVLHDKYGSRNQNKDIKPKLSEIKAEMEVGEAKIDEMSDRERNLMAKSLTLKSSNKSHNRPSKSRERKDPIDIELGGWVDIDLPSHEEESKRRRR